ncbi:MAG TPA: plastocyanin/azurin family copper-binding protein [Gammaproteobacteria bacterium]|nr:plastocyanin/azurin family copper-binding protein [Gammaproteobacteria bacterium]
MKPTRFYALVLTVCTLFISMAANAEKVRINAEARVFNPAIVYIQVGDTVSFDNMTSHNSVTYVTPDGAEGWRSQLGENLQVTIDQEGIYGYVCEPHIGFGMVGVVVVGTVTEEMKEAALQKARDTLEGPFRRLIGKLIKVEVPSEAGS